MKHKIIDVVSGREFIRVSRTIAAALGIDAAAVVGLLAALELDNGKWFDATDEQIAAELGISESRVARSVKTLSELGFVDVVRSDIPCRTYYSVNPGEVIAFITDAVEEPRVGGDE